MKCKTTNEHELNPYDTISVMQREKRKWCEIVLKASSCERHRNVQTNTWVEPGEAH